MSTHDTNKDEESEESEESEQSSSSDESEKVKFEEYVKQLSDIEREALEIAKRQLESSFDMEKSIGFLKFIE